MFGRVRVPLLSLIRNLAHSLIFTMKDPTVTLWTSSYFSETTKSGDTDGLSCFFQPQTYCDQSQYVYAKENLDPNAKSSALIVPDLKEHLESA